MLPAPSATLCKSHGISPCQSAQLDTNHMNISKSLHDLLRQYSIVFDFISPSPKYFLDISSAAFSM